MKLDLFRSLVAITCLIVGAQAGAQEITINELRVDQPGGDADEFFELAGPAGASLDGLYLINIQDNGFIDAAISLAGQVIPEDGFFFAAEDDDTLGEVADLIVPGALNFENGENAVYLLVSDFASSTGTDLDADDDGVFDAALPFTIVDGFALIDDDLTILDLDDEGLPGTEDINYGPALGVPTVGPDGTFFPGSVGAVPDGSETFAILDFGPEFNAAALGGNTPGLSNAVPEPTSVALLVLGSALAGAARRRR